MPKPTAHQVVNLLLTLFKRSFELQEKYTIVLKQWAKFKKAVSYMQDSTVPKMTTNYSIISCTQSFIYVILLYQHKDKRIGIEDDIKMKHGHCMAPIIR